MSDMPEAWATLADVERLRDARFHQLDVDDVRAPSLPRHPRRRLRSPRFRRGPLAACFATRSKLPSNRSVLRLFGKRSIVAPACSTLWRSAMAASALRDHRWRRAAASARGAPRMHGEDALDVIAAANLNLQAAEPRFPPALRRAPRGRRVHDWDRDVAFELRRLRASEPLVERHPCAACERVTQRGLERAAPAEALATGSAPEVPALALSTLLRSFPARARGPCSRC